MPRIVAAGGYTPGWGEFAWTVGLGMSGGEYGDFGGLRLVHFPSYYPTRYVIWVNLEPVSISYWSPSGVALKFFGGISWGCNTDACTSQNTALYFNLYVGAAVGYAFGSY